MTLSIGQIAEDKAIPEEMVQEVLEQALAAAYKKEYGRKGQRIEASIDPKTGETEFWQVKEVVDESMLLSEEELEELRRKREAEEEISEEEAEKVRFNSERHIMLEDAKEYDEEAEPGGTISIPLEHKADFGRIATQTAKQVILQKLREAERTAIYEEYADKEGEVISGLVQRYEGGVAYFDLGKVVAELPEHEQIPGESYEPGQRYKVYVLRVENASRGPQVVLSRAYPKLVSKLFELEVPEISAEQIEIHSLAREPGSRTKIAVSANETGLDPVGSCFPGSARILTEAMTYRPIKELAPGQSVITHKGNQKTISDTYKRFWHGTLRSFRVFGVYEEMWVTNEHPLLFTPDAETEPTFRAAGEIEDGYLAIPTLENIVADKTIYNFERDEDFLWVLGMYLAEGSLDKARVRFTLAKEERESAERIQEIMSTYGGVVEIGEYEAKPSILQVSLEGYFWRNVFKELANEYCDEKQLHPRLMMLNPELQMNIFEGWKEGDGYVGEERNREVVVTTSEELLWQMYHILLRNRIRGNMQKKREREDRKQSYALEVARNKTEDYRGFFRDGYYFSYISDIDTVSGMSNRRVFNLEVEDDNSYIAHSVAVHNCIGQRGSRVGAVIAELSGEKIDIIEYSEDHEEYIRNALSPAEVQEVNILPKNRALCIVPQDQLSLAIGKEGQNVRLAAELTGWKIDVQGAEEEEPSVSSEDAEEGIVADPDEEEQKEESEDEAMEGDKEEEETTHN